MVSFAVIVFLFVLICFLLCFFKQKTAYEMRISDWSSDVCSSDLLYLFSLKSATGLPWPEPNLTFLAYCIAGGIAQIMFTALLVWLFSFRNFSVGTTYSKTEVVQVAILGFVLLGDTIELIPSIAIRSEEPTSELQSLMRNSYAVF